MSDVSQSRQNVVMVGLLASLLIPRVQKLTGVTLTLDDVAALSALALVAWHGVASTLERYFPPPNPTPAVKPQETTK
jgi:hypothetical protein